MRPKAPPRLGFCNEFGIMALEKYNRKRDFAKTAEPKGAKPRARKRGPEHFVVQEHHARNLHFDLRLEIDGVLKSWAVPKGPSLDPSVRRLAVQTEDHPMKYLTFAGHIPEGNYGAGDMAVWDTGPFTIIEGKWAEGKLHVILEGRKLRGEFILVRLKQESQWLFFKAKDEFAEPGWVIETVIDDLTVGKDAAPPKSAGRAKAAPKKTAKSEAAPDPGSTPGARKAAMPKAVSPMLATLVSKPPAGDWIYEIKWDGYRAISHIEGGEADLISRNKIPLGAKFPELAEALAGLPVKQAVLDGEIVVLDDDGKPSFQLLQNRAGLYSKTRSRKKTSGQGSADATALFYAFDLLYLDGYNLRDCALVDRKALLQALLERASAELIRYSDHVSGAEAGPQLLDHARALGLEGIMAKRADSTYVERRSEKWLKIKIVQTTDVVIGGYTAPRNNRSHFGALVIGAYRAGKLHFAGHTGTGFNATSLKEIFGALQPLRTEKCPFVEKPATNEPAVWVKPQLVCEVKFTEWTHDGSLRHPVFMGLRADKAPKECVFEAPVPPGKLVDKAMKAKPAAKSTAKPATTDEAGTMDAEELFAKKKLTGTQHILADGIALDVTHLEKVYWPDDGYTKGDLLRYYYQLRETILPHLRDRPLILQRFPGGIGGTSFHQHNVENPPDFLETFVHEEGDETIHYAVCNNLASLLYLVNLGTIAQHTWLSTTEHPAKPDWIVFDLDPGEIDYKAVCTLALELKSVLDSLGIESVAKTSGSEGIHVCVPIVPNHTYDEVQIFTELVARTAQANRPDIATLERTLKKRPQNSIYLDHMQNREGKTVASVWSARAKPGATVSMPLSWAAIKRVPDPAAFTIATVPKGARAGGDPFAEALKHRADLTDVLGHLKNISGAGPNTGKARK